jgi:GTP cyclohydrolase IA
MENAMESSVAEKMLTFPSHLSPEALLVRDALVARGLETPMVHNGLSRDEKYRRITAAFTDITRTLGLDLNDDSLCETPHRIAKMYVDEIFSGLDYGKFPKITVIANKMRVEEMVQVDSIDLVSTCEHHFVTIDGSARVAYIPAAHIIGLSKINRIVRFFAQRPQVQERLTQQILVALQTLLGTDDVAVTINAVHYCVKSRGVMDTNSTTRTTALGGAFKTSAATRAEFIS